MSNIIPLTPMTMARLALLTPDEQRAYWNRVYTFWVRNTEAANDRDHQADHAAARAGDDWCQS